MADDSIECHILMGWIREPDFQNNSDKWQFFEERFLYCPYGEQHKLMAYMFSHLHDMSIQPWMLNLANKMVKQKNASYRNSEFKSNDTMVEYFIKQYSYGEIEQLRTSLWAIIK